MKVSTDQKKIREIIERGVEEIVEKRHLEEALKSGKRLRVKHGIDPTGPRIHLGRASQFWKLKALQDLGHQIVLIIGDFTALIGDASDKDSLRPVLTEEQIGENMKDYAAQIGKILDMEKVELRYNSEWLDKMTVRELIKLSMKFTAQQMIHRRNFRERWDNGKEIGLHELFYPLFQGYDSVAVKADLELGGSDQLFNLLRGRDLQLFFGQEPQDIMTTKMLSGTDGRKMSTSWGNIITIVDEAGDMYGKVMSMRDECIPEYFELCTQADLNEIKKIKNDIEDDQINPREAKARLAKEIVSLYYGKETADEAEKEFDRVFRGKEMPHDVPVDNVKKGKYPILEFLVKIKLVSSKAEAKRLVNQGGVSIGGEQERDWQKEIDIQKEVTIKVGKRRFVKVVAG